MLDFLEAYKDPEFRSAIAQGLKDAANRGAASFFGGPVDLATMAMRPLGYSTPDRDVVGGSEWIGKQMESRGMVSTARNPIAEVLAAVALPVGMARSAPGIFRAEQQAVQNAMAQRTLDPQTGAIVWHGSPHQFDKFDASKIGTGEGAQAYGHGLYVAETKDVAKEYADKLGDMVFHYQGKPLQPDSIDDLAAQYLFGQSGDKAAAIDDAVGNRALQNAIRRMDYSQVQRGGALYKVDLPDEHIAKMLDWDKPLSEQAQEVKQFVQSVITDPKNAGFKTVPVENGMVNIVAPNGQILGVERADMAGDAMKIYAEGFMKNIKTGKDLVQRFASPGLGGQPVAENMMRAQGIPGIRYLDGGSRGAGAGTSNFVVFPGNENLLQILERNGKPLAK